MSSLRTPRLPETDGQVTGARCGGRMLIHIDRTVSDRSQAPRQEAATVLSLLNLQFNSFKLRSRLAACVPTDFK